MSKRFVTPMKVPETGPLLFDLGHTVERRRDRLGPYVIRVAEGDVFIRIDLSHHVWRELIERAAFSKGGRAVEAGGAIWVTVENREMSEESVEE
jgi:hypothetical protein